MAKLLHLSRPSKRMGDAVRTWWAMRSQKRRRQRSGAAESSVPVAEITGGSFTWDQTETGWADVTIYWAADTAGWPDGQFELWCQAGGMPEQLLATLPSSDRVFEYTRVTNEEMSLLFRVRFRSGAEVGEFSNAFEVMVLM